MKHPRLARGQQVSAKVVAVFNKRMQVANDKFTKRVSEAFAGVGGMAPLPLLAHRPQAQGRRKGT